MPVSDAAYMLWDDDTELDDGTGEVVDMGPGPFEPVLLRTYLPDLVSITLEIEQHDTGDPEALDWEPIEVQQKTDFAYAGTELSVIQWSKRYLRVVASANGGDALPGCSIGIIQGKIPQTYALL